MPRILAALAPALLLAAATPAAARAAQVAYAPTDEVFANPERGFFTQQEDLPAAALEAPAPGSTVVRAVFRLDAHRGDDVLPPAYLDAVRARLAEARAAGLKVVVRFAYDYTREGADAPLQRVLGHVDQLAPVVNAEADVVAYVEAGFIGAWGEWNTSANGLIGGAVDGRAGTSEFQTPNAATAAIAERLRRRITSTRFVALRYPGTKRALVGLAPATRAAVQGGTPRGRFGHHNDCFLASANDWWTYPTQSVRALKDYVHEDALVTVNGGETCNDDPAQTRCANAVAQAERLRLSTLNGRFHGAVLERWRREGCLAAIGRRLGYRLALVDATLPDGAAAGGRLRLRLRVRNEGFAAPYNARPVDVVLRERATGALQRVATGVDARAFAPGTTRTVAVDAPLPALAPGAYDLLLHLPDASPRLRERPAYAVRLANAGVWEAATGLNALGGTVRVTRARSGARVAERSMARRRSAS